MNEHKTDEIQIIQKLFTKYKYFVLAICFFGFMTFVTVEYYKHHNKVQCKNAGLIYKNMIFGIQRHNKATTIKEGEKLVLNYKNTPYFQLGSALLAKLAIEENRLDDAFQYLKDATYYKKDSVIYHLSVARMARVLHSMGKSEQALELLENNKNNTYQSLYNSIAGDIYFRLDKSKQAKEFYLSSYTKSDQSRIPPYLKLKLMDLGIKDVNDYVHRESL